MKRSLRIAVLVEPKVQVRLVAFCLLIGIGAALIQAVVVGGLYQYFADQPYGTGALLPEDVHGLLWTGFLVSLSVTIPASMAVGMLGVFRFVGPMQRIRRFLEAVKRGEHPEPCTIRKGDLLQDVVDLLNDVTEPLRREQTSEAATPETAEAPEEEPVLV